MNLRSTILLPTLAVLWSAVQGCGTLSHIDGTEAPAQDSLSLSLTQVQTQVRTEVETAPQGLTQTEPAEAQDSAAAATVTGINLKTGIDAMSVRSLKETISILTDAKAGGRYTGSEGSRYCRYYLTEKLYYSGVERLGESYAEVFFFGDEAEPGVNIVGLLPAGKGDRTEADTTKDYIVIGAHYDHLGEMNGTVYPGADNNASGTAALVEIAKGLRELQRSGAELKSNVIFVAFDAKEQGLAGSRYFLSDIGSGKRIKFMLNLDQIGTNFSPPGESKEYLLAIGIESFDAVNGEDEGRAIGSGRMKQAFAKANGNEELGLDIDYTFYGSREFYGIFKRISDQYPFIRAGIPALMLTSGIHEHTMKTTDTRNIINYPQLMLRCRLIYYLLCDFLVEE